MCSGIIILWITVHYAGLYAVSYFAIFLAAAGYAAQAPIVSAGEPVNVHDFTFAYIVVRL